jgi:glyoxylase-like metal-dependent hydrolase (beta-lactamase superfamily II)
MRMILVALLVALALPATAQEAKRSLENVAGDVWRFNNDFHSSAVVVTEDGVVVTDPINAAAAEWLSDEIERQFAKPITHLVYSHSHADHASGGTAFGDVQAIAHADAPTEIDGVAIDRRISEATTLDVGGKTLELVPLGPGHGTDMMAMVVRPENVAFVVDVVSPGRVPYKDMPGADLDGLAKQIERVGALDFEVLLPGHAKLGTNEDVAEAAEYLAWLRAEVQAGLDAGKSLEVIQSEMDWTPYADMMMVDEWGPMNVEGMARWLD